MGKKITGRRRPDLPEGDIQPDLAVGDYWKVLGADGTPKRSDAKSNLETSREPRLYAAAPIRSPLPRSARTPLAHQPPGIRRPRRPGSSRTVAQTPCLCPWVATASRARGRPQEPRWP